MTRDGSRRHGCGLGACRPAWMLRFATVGWFTFFASTFSFFFGLFPLYTVSQVTTIEKHFDLSSQRSGMVVSGSEIGFVISAIVVGYFLNHAHRPRILGYCTVAILSACLIFTVPLYMDLARGRITKPGHLMGFNDTCAGKSNLNCESETLEVRNAFWVFLVAVIFYGIGSCGMWTIGLSYIDDNADRRQSYFYISLVMCIRFLSPVGGMLLGAVVAPVPVHLEYTGGTPEDNDWVGAWWIGYYVIFILVFVSSIPIWFYPKVISFQSHSVQSTSDIFTIANPYTEVSEEVTDSNQNLPQIKPDQDQNLPPTGKDSHKNQPAVKPSETPSNLYPKLHSESDSGIIHREHHQNGGATNHVYNNSSSVENGNLATRVAGHAVNGNALTDGRANGNGIANGNANGNERQMEERDLRNDVKRKSAMEGAKILIEGFPSAILRLFKNPIFMTAAVASAIDYSISVGYATFVPKYLEMYFHTTASTANLITGISLALSAALGSGIGGYLMSKINLKLNKMVLISAIVNISMTALVVPMIFIKCEGIKMIGITESDTSLTSSCNAGCNCHASMYNPVCDNDIAYYSPCHAGCSTMMHNGTYTDCACAGSRHDVMSPGLCAEECTTNMIIYSTLLFIMGVFLAAAALPPLMLTIRSIDEKDKALALAVLNVFTSIVAFPTPVLYGSMIDSVCLVLNQFVCQEGAACMIYDNESFKYRLHFLTLGLKILPTGLCLTSWFLSRNSVFPGDRKLIEREPEVAEVHENPAVESSPVRSHPYGLELSTSV